ncbi:Sonic hedgehog protein A [Ooceraea biroi]|uniref:Hedgehog protein n=1 Tax=Ooceraea biroi TaxID=2015173 RepID=A0A026VYY2_OOCBI|nr:Sonic hedgehog protein A [Ooceraea biroi]
MKRGETRVVPERENKIYCSACSRRRDRQAAASSPPRKNRSDAPENCPLPRIQQQPSEKKKNRRRRRRGRSLRRGGSGGRSLGSHRARLRASGPTVPTTLPGHPYHTALRGRLPSENRFKHGPRTLRMPSDNAASRSMQFPSRSASRPLNTPRSALNSGFNTDPCRCKEKLNTLAISVMNQWPGIKLRVTESWDEDGKHAMDSLHYEGRAVDVTTSDRDRAKYGMLARLAVEAGFDWVYYEARSHIHCSVKSDSSSVGKSGGCFPGKSLVRTENGDAKRLDEVRLGERIAALDSRGDVVYSEVIAFLDRSPSERRQFIRLTTKSGRVLTLTPAHLVPVEGRSSVFAAKVQPGDRILVNDVAASVEDDNRVDNRLRWDSVVETKLVLEEGVFAPLTTEGTLVVDDVVASCYAVVDSQSVAHYAFLPLRIWNAVTSVFTGGLDDMRHLEIRQNDTSKVQPTVKEGVHWYASMLYSLSSYMLPSTMLYN